MMYWLRSLGEPTDNVGNVGEGEDVDDESEGESEDDPDEGAGAGHDGRAAGPAGAGASGSFGSSIVFENARFASHEAAKEALNRVEIDQHKKYKLFEKGSTSRHKIWRCDGFYKPGTQEEKPNGCKACVVFAVNKPKQNPESPWAARKVNFVHTACSSEANPGIRELAALPEFRKRVNENRGATGKELSRILHTTYLLSTSLRTVYAARTHIGGPGGRVVLVPAKFRSFVLVLAKTPPFSASGGGAEAERGGLRVHSFPSRSRWRAGTCCTAARPTTR